MQFLSAPSQMALAGLQSYGINPSIPNPWLGTERLHESKNNEAGIQCFVRMDLTDIEAYHQMSDQLEAHAAIQPGILFHQTYQLNESEIIVMEQYANEEAFLAWVDVFTANSGDFNSLVKSLALEVFGSPTGKCKEALDGWGAVYYPKISGFTRF